jgi:hypothetical protein
MRIDDEVQVRIRGTVWQIEKGPTFLIKPNNSSLLLWATEDDILSEVAEHRADVSELILRQIIDALPVQRDWLDPTLERAVRYILRRAEKNKDGDNEDAT